MEIRKVKVSDLRPAEYNPRQDLKPGDREYEKIARSIDEFGYVEPIVWNETTGNIVGGHQRLKILIERGETEVEVSVVRLNEHDEKVLNVALNKITGRWDTGKLTDLLKELQAEGAMEVTGFEDWELDALSMQYDHIDDLLNEDFSEFAAKEPKDTFTMTFTLPEDVKTAVQEYIETTPNAKAELATAIINKVKGVS
jgi:ParB-like chromosome segregation protein Spo0J|uniref:ParB protein n=1 Tax=Siphoviridae sp. ctdHi7 TaxID=2825577 RepID=A0A8S5U1U8_9CAUD|nr:MAG TPA: ParB protein [Siphoviridae sp. ctdHi7]